MVMHDEVTARSANGIRPKSEWVNQIPNSLEVDAAMPGCQTHYLPPNGVGSPRISRILRKTDHRNTIVWVTR